MTTSDLVFTASSTYINTPCPPYCDLKPLHPVDNLQGAGGDFRIHGGPKFGTLLEGYAEEYVRAPGVLRPRVYIASEPDQTIDFDDPAELRQLAANATAAAEWLEAQR